MSSTVAKHNWRESPPGDAFEMVNDGGPAFTLASDSRGRDKRTLAYLLDCEFTEVRMTTVYLLWEPEEAEREWRESRCECEEPHYGDTDFAGCESTKPAEDVWDFWDETGSYCPWAGARRTTPGAVAFRRGEVAA